MSILDIKSSVVSVIGLGYIGLPTAAIVAENGYKVVGVDVNEHAVSCVNRGEIHIVEPGLAESVKDAVDAGLLHAVTTPVPADVYVIAVPTPCHSDKKPDTSYVAEVARQIAPLIKIGDTIILESTSPVGTTEMVGDIISEMRSELKLATSFDDESHEVFIAHCPERVLPGRAMIELVENDRIIGGLSRLCAERTASFYRSFIRGEAIVTSARTAEMSKLTENAFRDVNIAFANELSMICDSLDIDVWELIRLANRHPRVDILQPGPGVGGHCIAVDPWFIVASAPGQAKLIAAARGVNDLKPNWVIEQVERALQKVRETGNEEPRITALGLAFKADIDDLRESPALYITNRLADLGYSVNAVEPNVSSHPSLLDKRVKLLNLEDSIRCSDVVVVLVDHKEFRELDLTDFEGRTVIDTKGMLV